MINQSIILAGGFGTRLGKLTSITPKPLLQVAGRPFLEHLIHNIRSHGVTNVILSVGYLGQQIGEYFRDGRKFGVSIDYVFESKPAGTAGALLLAREKLEENFFAVNGDTFFDIDYSDLAFLHENSHAMATIALRNIGDIRRYGTVVLENGRITQFVDRGITGSGLINGGVYAMRRKIFEWFQTDASFGSLEKDVFPALAGRNLLAGKEYDGCFVDIGLPESLEEANQLLKNY